MRLENYGSNENRTWEISSNCNDVHVRSTKFETEEGYDLLTIDGVAYSGSTPVDVVVEGGNFLITFQSDRSVQKDGFVLQWTCYNGKDIVWLSPF